MRLAELAGKLRMGPQSLHGLRRALENAEVVSDFRRLVHDFTPQAEARILAGDEQEQVQAFLREFGRQTGIPLNDDIEEIEQLLFCMPIIVRGWSWDDYMEWSHHDVPDQVLLALVQSPFMDEDNAALVENLARLVRGEAYEAWRLATPTGWEPAELHERLDGTRWEGVARFADWLWRETQTVYLDMNYEEMNNDLEWSQANVRWLREQAVTAGQIEDRIAEVYHLIEQNPTEAVLDMVRLMGPRPGPQLPLPLLEVFRDEQES